MLAMCMAFFYTQRDFMVLREAYDTYIEGISMSIFQMKAQNKKGRLKVLLKILCL